MSLIKISYQDNIAHVELNFPERSNSLNYELLHQGCSLWKALSKNPEIKIVVLSGTGKNFCTGANIEWLFALKDKKYWQRLSSAWLLQKFLYDYASLPQITIAKINGACYGGGIGLVAASDFAFTSEKSNFCLPEVKLGLIPILISPFCLEKINQEKFKYYTLTSEIFSPQVALSIDLVNEICADDFLMEKDILKLSDKILRNDFNACIASKVSINRHRNKGNYTLLAKMRRCHIFAQLVKNLKIKQIRTNFS